MPFSEKHLNAVIYLSIFLAAALLAIVSALSLADSLRASNTVISGVAANIPVAIALLALWKKPSRAGSTLPFWGLIGGAVLMRAVLLPGAPIFSDDIFRFLWDGRVQSAGFGPWDFAPDAEELQSLRNVDWHRINNPELRTIYPPIAEYLFFLADRIFSSVYVLKAMALVADLIVVVLIFFLAGGTVRGGFQRNAFLPAALYGWSPVVCMETTLSGHVLEPVALALTLGALLVLKQQPIRRWGVVTSASLLAVAAGVKLAPLFMALPLSNRRRWLLPVALFVGVLVLCPMMLAGTAGVETLDEFARRWEGNAGLFRLFKWGAIYLVGGISGTSDPGAMIDLPFLEGIAEALQPTFFALHKDGAFDPLHPAAFPLLDIGMALARLVSLSIFATVLFLSVFKKMEPIRAGLIIFGTLVVVTPVLHPWYALWVLPFAALSGRTGWFVFAATLPLSYFSLDTWWERGVWQEQTPVLLIEYTALSFALFERIIMDRIRKNHAVVDGKSP